MRHSSIRGAPRGSGRGHDGSSVLPVSGIHQKAGILQLPLFTATIIVCSQPDIARQDVPVLARIPRTSAQTPSAAPCMACHSNGWHSLQCSHCVALHRTCGLRMTTLNNNPAPESRRRGNCHNVSGMPICPSMPLGELGGRPLTSVSWNDIEFRRGWPVSVSCGPYRNGWL